MTSQGLALAFNGGITPRQQVGGSFGSFLKGAHDFIKKNKIISTVANLAGTAGVPYASTIGKVASSTGYGKKKKSAKGKKGKKK